LQENDVATLLENVLDLNVLDPVENVIVLEELQRRDASTRSKESVLNQRLYPKDIDVLFPLNHISSLLMERNSMEEKLVDSLLSRENHSEYSLKERSGELPQLPHPSLL